MMPHQSMPPSIDDISSVLDAMDHDTHMHCGKTSSNNHLKSPDNSGHLNIQRYGHVAKPALAGKLKPLHSKFDPPNHLHDGHDGNRTNERSMVTPGNSHFAEPLRPTTSVEGHHAGTHAVGASRPRTAALLRPVPMSPAGERRKSSFDVGAFEGKQRLADHKLAEALVFVTRANDRMRPQEEHICMPDHVPQESPGDDTASKSSSRHDVASPSASLAICNRRLSVNYASSDRWSVHSGSPPGAGSIDKTLINEGFMGLNRTRSLDDNTSACQDDEEVMNARLDGRALHLAARMPSAPVCVTPPCAPLPMTRSPSSEAGQARKSSPSSDRAGSAHNDRAGSAHNDRAGSAHNDGAGSAHNDGAGSAHKRMLSARSVAKRLDDERISGWGTAEENFPRDSEPPVIDGIPLVPAAEACVRPSKQSSSSSCKAPSISPLASAKERGLLSRSQGSPGKSSSGGGFRRDTGGKDSPRTFVFKKNPTNLLKKHLPGYTGNSSPRRQSDVRVPQNTRAPLPPGPSSETSHPRLDACHQSDMLEAASSASEQRQSTGSFCGSLGDPPFAALSLSATTPTARSAASPMAMAASPVDVAGPKMSPTAVWGSAGKPPLPARRAVGRRMSCIVGGDASAESGKISRSLFMRGDSFGRTSSSDAAEKLRLSRIEESSQFGRAVSFEDSNASQKAMMGEQVDDVFAEMKKERSADMAKGRKARRGSMMPIASHSLLANEEDKEEEIQATIVRFKALMDIAAERRAKEAHVREVAQAPSTTGLINVVTVAIPKRRSVVYEKPLVQRHVARRRSSVVVVEPAPHVPVPEPSPTALPLPLELETAPAPRLPAPAPVLPAPVPVLPAPEEEQEEEDQAEAELEEPEHEWKAILLPLNEVVDFVADKIARRFPNTMVPPMEMLNEASNLRHIDRWRCHQNNTAVLKFVMQLDLRDPTKPANVFVIDKPPAEVEAMILTKDLVPGAAARIRAQTLWNKLRRHVRSRATIKQFARKSDENEAKNPKWIFRTIYFQNTESIGVRKLADIFVL